MNEHELATLKDTVNIASPLIKTLIDTFLTPKLISFRDRFKINEKTEEIPSEEQFKEYFIRTYKRLIVVNTLVFNNSQRFLNDIYQPLTIFTRDTNNSEIKVKVEGFPASISNTYGNILITDTAGMGKSTMMKVIFLDIINKNLGIPIFIELRRLSKNKKIIDEIKEQLSSISRIFDNSLLLNLLAEGGFIMILDGYDEIPLSDRDQVTSDIQEFISKTSNNRFFITSRPENALASFGHFKEFKIQPLKKEEAFKLLGKYDHCGTVSTLLIKKLKEEDMGNIKEFLTNPLLVSLLFTAFEHKQTIPFKKYLFYRQVYDANFQLHDLTKGESYTHNKYSKLEIDDFHRVLRHIGFSCLRDQRIEFSKDELLKLIKESRLFCAGLSFNDSDFLKDIINTVPLFAKDGNYYRWAHKSLQEYFAAQYIYLDAKEKQSGILKHLYHSSKIKGFMNIIDLYYDMDYKGFRNEIELSLLEDYERHCSAINSNQTVDVETDLVVTRKELTFMCDHYVFTTETDAHSPELGDPVSKIVGKHSKKRFSDEHKGDVMVMSGDKEGRFGLFYVDSKLSMLDLLGGKNSPIVKSGSRSAAMEFSYVPRPSEPVAFIEIPALEVPPKEHYRQVNNSLAMGYFSHYHIDHYAAMEKLKEIRDSIAHDANSDLFNCS